MENVGVMVPFIKVFFYWHIFGFVALLIGSRVVYRIIEASEK